MKTPIDDFDFDFAGPVVIALPRRTLFVLFLALAGAAYAIVITRSLT
jgi:hypothetical protein